MSLQKYLLICTCLIGFRLASSARPRKVYKEDGDLLIGGLMPLHDHSDSSERCSERRDIGSLRLVEALVFALSTADKTGLGELTLGYEIYDTCSSTSETLWNSIAFIPPVRRKNNILGVVGPQRSSSSIQATQLLGLYDIPVISYLSTSDELSDSGKYPYFFRTVPPDKFQVNVIVDILAKYNWTYVAFIYSDDTYGHNAMTAFLDQTKHSDICVDYKSELSVTAPDDTYRRTLTDLKKLRPKTFISVVILFIQLEMAKNLFRLAQEQGIYREFIWIGSDGWGNYGLDPVLGVEETALGALTIVPKSGKLPNFDSYFRDTSLSSDNPWLDEFRDEIDAGRFHSDDHIGDRDRPHFESMVSDAVGVYIQALSDMKAAICVGSDSPTACAENIISRRPLFFTEFLMNVSIRSPSNGLLQFAANGDPVGRYDIWQLQLTGEDEYRFTTIGNWSDNGNFIEQPQFYLQDRARFPETDDIPLSVCSRPCGPREEKMREGCCWSCVACDASEILVDNICVDCYHPENSTYEWPDEDMDTCEQLPYLRIADKLESIAVIVVSSLCLVLQLIIVVLYAKNKDAKLIRASSRELCCIILVGVFFTLVYSMIYTMPSSMTTCIILRVVPYMALSLIYVPLATMTIRLHRIFQAGKRSTKRPRFISPASQIILSLAFTMIPMIWSTLWIAYDSPRVLILKGENDRGQPCLKSICNTSYPQLIGNLVWHFLVVATCCYFAIRTRQLPSNYNQTRFIAFATFCSLVVFLAFTPAFFFSSDSRLRALYSSLGAILQAVVVLILLFAVKLYAVYCVQEEKQVLVSTTRVQKTEDEEEMTTQPQTKTTSAVTTSDAPGSVQEVK